MKTINSKIIILTLYRWKEMGNAYNVCVNSSELEKYQDYPRTDTHCHTTYSDGCWSIQALVKKAKKLGFKIVLKTDHNTTKGNQQMAKLCKEEDLIYIPAIEISTNKGHLLGYNVWDWPRHLRSFEDCVDRLHQINALAIYAHPWWQTAIQKGSIQEAVFQLKDLDGYEGLNGASPFGCIHYFRHVYRQNIMQKMNIYKYSCWAGSDSHGGYIYGQYFNVIQTTDFSLDGVLEAMRKGKIIAVAPLLPLISWFIDGAINQPVQLKKQLFYRKK